MQLKVLVLGAGGQLGQELTGTVPDTVCCTSLVRDQLDIGDEGAVAGYLGANAPEVVINAAAYTAVDAAESAPDTAFRINGEAPGILARHCAQVGARLIHVSTDFVFDGASSTPYTPDSATAPLGEYGRSKLAGERAVLAAAGDALVVRTGWVYSSFGANFVKTMLRLMAQRDCLEVVDDQVGTPTWAHGLALALWRAVELPRLNGIYHWSDAGVCSWYDFAVAIAEEGLATGLLARLPQVQPIPCSGYPTPARRPAYSVLDKSATWRDFGLQGVHWRHQLRAMLREYKELEGA